jgi:hypothetical protein
MVKKVMVVLMGVMLVFGIGCSVFSTTRKAQDRDEFEDDFADVTFTQGNWEARRAHSFAAVVESDEIGIGIQDEMLKLDPPETPSTHNWGSVFVKNLAVSNYFIKTKMKIENLQGGHAGGCD